MALTASPVTPMKNLVTRAGVPKKQLNPLLSVRGGAGPLNEASVAKAATCFLGAYGGLIVLSPKKMIEGYGLGATPETDFVGKNSGVSIFSAALAMWCRIFKDSSVNHAAGLATIPWILCCVHSILNDKPKEIGYPAAVDYLNLAIFVFGAFATLTDASYANNVVKAMALWALANGLILAVNPVAFGKSYHVKQMGVIGRDELLMYSWKTYGYDLIWLGIFMGLMGSGVDDLKAIGYSWLPGLIYLITVLFTSKEAEKFGMPKGPLYAWLIVEAIVLGTLCI